MGPSSIPGIPYDLWSLLIAGMAHHPPIIKNNKYKAVQMSYQEQSFQQEQPQLLMNIMIITCCAPTAKGPQILGHEYMSQEEMGWCFQERNRSQETLLGVG